MHVWKYATFGSFLQHIDHTRVHGEWITYQPRQGSIESSWDGMVDLAAALDQAKTLRGLEDTLLQIASFQTDLQRHVTLPQTLRRVPMAHASRGTLNPHRVLRGSTKPYQTRTMATTPQHGRLVHIVIPGAFGYEHGNTEVLLAGVASVTLADMLQAAGYNVTVSSATLALGLLPAQTKRDTMQDTCVVVGLRDNHMSWSLHTLAVAVQPTFLRRLMFRYWESMVPQYGDLAPTYGTSPNDAARAIPRIQEALGNATPITIGAGPWDHVTTPARAAAWIQTKLATMTA